jgi:hypothetical protein
MADECVELGVVIAMCGVEHRLNAELVSESVSPGSYLWSGLSRYGKDCVMNCGVPFPECSGDSLEDLGDERVVQAEPDKHNSTCSE